MKAQKLQPSSRDYALRPTIRPKLAVRLEPNGKRFDFDFEGIGVIGASVNSSTLDMELQRLEISATDPRFLYFVRCAVDEWVYRVREFATLLGATCSLSETNEYMPTSGLGALQEWWTPIRILGMHLFCAIRCQVKFRKSAPRPQWGDFSAFPRGRNASYEEAMQVFMQNATVVRLGDRATAYEEGCYPGSMIPATDVDHELCIVASSLIASPFARDGVRKGDLERCRHLGQFLQDRYRPRSDLKFGPSDIKERIFGALDSTPRTFEELAKRAGVKVNSNARQKLADLVREHMCLRPFRGRYVKPLSSHLSRH